MKKAHPLASINYRTQLQIACDTVLISYCPVYALSHQIAHSLQQLQSLIAIHASKSQCLILCTQQQKCKLQAQIHKYIQNIEVGSEGRVREDDQLIDDLSDDSSDGKIRQQLALKLEEIMERTEKKVRESQIKMKMAQIDLQIQKIQELKARCEGKKNVTKEMTCEKGATARNGQKMGKKDRKKQKGLQKKLQKLKSKQQFLNQSENGGKNPGKILELLKEDNHEQEESDSILL